MLYAEKKLTFRSLADVEVPTLSLTRSKCVNKEKRVGNPYLHTWYRSVML